MAKMNSVSGILLVVDDLQKSTEFYEKLGFNFRDKTDKYAKCYLNWFWLELVPFDQVEPTLFKRVAETEQVANKGAGLFVHISVAAVDEYYQAVLDAGLQPSSEPRDWPWGRREFVLRDPDGYKLVFFQKS